MKELSIEEKAKRYDEAIERISKYVKDEYGCTRLRPEDIFLELKESEDEKIRGAILHFISHTPTVPKGLISKEDMIAWLEKQGKNNMGISEATKKKLEDNLNRALEKETPESWNKFLDEQGEQKLTEWSEKTKGLDELETYILSLVPNRPLDAIKVDSKNIRFLINKEQKPAWSEEDEYMIDFISKRLFSLGADLSSSEIKWLKSLKDKYTWKPSDEQIKGIECAIKTLQHQLNVGDKRLNSLYDDLKKLMEK